MARVILVVESNDMMRRVLTSVLEKAGGEVVEALDGAEAVRKLEEGLMPAAVIVEPAVPLVDGFELLRRVRSHPRWKAIPVLFCSSRNSPEDLQKATAAGVAGYIVKPSLSRETVLPPLKKALEAARRPPPAKAV